ncbi:MAG: methyltransferase domain-containing protein [Vicinamibacterales bacterium]|nr:methyltransferase domain-containing protein [Vicinamibacterales bacterium]
MTQFGDYRAFLTQFLRNYETTGAVVPSGRALASALCRYVGTATSPQRILEAGPGTGAVSRRIVERMRPVDQLWMVELNPAFAAHLRSAFRTDPGLSAAADRCHIVEGSVQALETDGRFDLVISGLPLNNFPAEDVTSILDAYSKLLKPQGVLSFFQYMFIRPAKMMVSTGSERNRLKGVGHAIEGVLGEHELAREWVWSNVPPAWVHHVRF